MREMTIGAEIKPGTRLDEHILSVFPALNKNALYKAFRKKDVKVGGRRAPPDTRLSAGDVVRVYLPDDFLFGGRLFDPAAGPDAGAPHAAGFSVAYEDDRVLIVNKPRGLPAHPDGGGSGVTLIELVREYLLTRSSGARSPCPAVPGAKRSGAPYSAGSPNPGSAVPGPALCHRLDRNTGGLVLIAKDKEALTVMLEHISSGAIHKLYRCVVAGRPEQPVSELRVKNTLHGLAGGGTVRLATKADNLFVHFTGPRIGGHDDDYVLKIGFFSGVIGQGAIIHHLQQYI